MLPRQLLYQSRLLQARLSALCRPVSGLVNVQIPGPPALSDTVRALQKPAGQRGRGLLSQNHPQVLESHSG